MADPARLPVVVACNLEPDDRVTGIDGRSPWVGVGTLLDVVEQWRADAPDLCLTWLWRCDPAIAKGFGDAGWALRRWRSQILDAAARGDDVGIHPHIWRWSEPLKTFVADQANDAWKAECVRVSAEAFARETAIEPRTVQMGDGYMDPAILRALVDAGITLDLTLEPGGPAKERMVHTELTTGALPDRRRTPRHPFRPGWSDACRPQRRHAPMWALPITTSTVPLVIDGVVVDPAGTAANLGLDPHRFRHVVTTGLAASVAAGAPYVNAQLRSDVGADARLGEFTLQNLEWLRTGMRGLADPWGGTELVTGPTALARLGYVT